MEISGYIRKEERLQNLESSIIQGTMVLETVDPFNGYYSANPDEYVPRTIFFITNKKYSKEDVARYTRAVSKKLQIDIDAVYAEVIIQNELYYAIRLYDFKEYGIIESIQQAFQNLGIEFKKTSQKVSALCRIKIYKVFLVQESSQGIYTNASKSKMFYFTIPVELEFTEFTALVQKVKNNWTGKDFDAAQGFFFRKHTAEDVVRIFSNHISDEMKQQLVQKFNSFIE
ncbi:MAG TPA: hypothetical protein PK734_00830 [Bacteroidales bacterium]|nr:MAG: hypothetical protein BWY22_01321 [Bacteroidetes bacterium ADurb.Bin217]HPM12015.1 hypothetical protein [Bacteroidales bacterium]